MKTLLALFALALPVSAATSLDRTFHVSTVIPDNSIIGIADSRMVVSPLGEIAEIRVGLAISGGWNGDLYAYLSHGSGFSVLLNRPGRELAFPDGSASSGMNVVFADSAAEDIHLAVPSSGYVTGLYQPDARAADPASALDTTARTTFLGSFTGLDPNGEWTLFVADLSPGGTSVLQSWSLEIIPVPEPSATLLALAGTLVLLRRRRRL